jgi:hypothetical protein
VARGIVSGRRGPRHTGQPSPSTARQAKNQLCRLMVPTRLPVVRQSGFVHVQEESSWTTIVPVHADGSDFPRMSPSVDHPGPRP